MSEEILNWKRPSSKRELLKIRRKYDWQTFVILYIVGIILFSFSWIVKEDLSKATLIVISSILLISVLTATYLLVKYLCQDRSQAIKYQSLTTDSYHDYYRLIRMAGRNRVVRDIFKIWLNSEVGLLKGDYLAVESYLKGNALKERVLKMATLP